ncbi:hypothetical protein DFH06DRAFT_1121827 [Mycena polygramma]|nr:hypothetical protein DFH06DRAFT_1121827 [Mycena polygramma]
MVFWATLRGVVEREMSERGALADEQKIRRSKMKRRRHAPKEVGPIQREKGGRASAGARREARAEQARGGSGGRKGGIGRKSRATASKACNPRWMHPGKKAGKAGAAGSRGRERAEQARRETDK